MTRYAEHIEDVLAAWLDQHAAGGAALVVITLTEGGGVRPLGAAMTVSHTGHCVGYISGGCLDADVARHAVDALSDGRARKLRYGSGSPFLDLPLPCGGTIEVLILPAADPSIVRRCGDLLAARSPLHVGFLDTGEIVVSPDAEGDHVFTYLPKLRIRIAGRGADALALYRGATAAGLLPILQMPEHEVGDVDPPLDLSRVSQLRSTKELTTVEDDPWTAVILALHDAEWEAPLLIQALNGPAFFVGAIGSRRTHARRANRLRELGIEEHQIDRIRAPVGLIPAMRDASFLAVSVLAEVLDCWKRIVTAKEVRGPGMAARRFPFDYQ